MSTWKKNNILFGLYAILLFGAAHGLYGIDHRHGPSLPGVYPENSFSKWNSKALKNNIYEDALLSAGKVYKRVYFNNNDFLWYVLVESINGHHGQHQPEICYTGNGWSVQKRDSVVIPNSRAPINATGLFLNRKEERRLVVYWYSNGNITTGSFYKRVFQQIWDEWTEKPYSVWNFHRISLPVLEPMDQSLEIINSFIREINFNQRGDRV